MPFKSQAQRRFMYAKHPDLAEEFEEATPKGKKLPARKGSGMGGSIPGINRKKKKKEHE